MAVLIYLAEADKTSCVSLWGRSMGGATALLFEEDSTPLPVSCLVIDSAFSSFADVAKHTITEQMKLPPELFAMMWPSVV